jgi:(1->4)-alpha-D-glucan 1-alpha-D-glucosylmutase
MTMRATMRLQLHKGFTFDAAAAVVPYLAGLGISHVYASPIMTARAGSMHGYDVTDPTRINPELGGEEGLKRLSRALRDRNMGLIIDIVPNHMAIGSDNAWWMDVLAHGPESRFADFFDIDWEPEEPALRAKVLLPILGQPYGKALAAGQIKLTRDPAGTFAIRYFDHVLPLSPRDCPALEREPLEAFDPSSSAGRERLHQLLEQQHYRLAWWRAANDIINWRRFFDINDLIALRMENGAAFEAVHAAALRLYRDGLIDGLRIDHIDGLSRPGEYCVKLRERLNAFAEQRHDRPYIVVEKILADDEPLPQSWETDGTTGYDFMHQVSALQHDAAGERPLSQFWHRISGRPADFSAEEEASRRQVLEQSFAGQLDATARAFHVIARRSLHTRDDTRAAIRRVLTEILVHFPVYRIYVTTGGTSRSDRSVLAKALARAKVTCLPGDRCLLDTLSQWLFGDGADPECHPRSASAITRFQQLSAPLSAKAVEDTAFYRYGRLLSRNDVGFDPRRFTYSIADFHRAATARYDRFPRTLLTTASHDHKRGEDVRARLAVLSEIPNEWAEHVERWIAASEGLRTTQDGWCAPTAGDLAILFQMVVGAWPLELAWHNPAELSAFEQRVASWQQKALREAKLNSDWSEPNVQYEKAAREFLARLFHDRTDLLGEIAAFTWRIASAGAVNGLAQMLLKLTVPGIPDIYQGTEYWDFSLVDPDNRRNIDFAARQRTLTSRPPAELADHWRDGRLKQAVLATALAIRSSAPELFTEGDYIPLVVRGARAEHLVAFARRLQSVAAVVMVCRRPACLLIADTVKIPSAAWDDTHLPLPEELRAITFSNALDPCAAPSRDGVVNIAATLARLPVALLVSQAQPPEYFAMQRREMFKTSRRP